MSKTNGSIKKQTKPTVNLVTLIIVAALAIIIFFFLTGIPGQTGSSTENIISYPMLGVIGILLVLLVLFKTMVRTSIPQPNKIFTMLQCTKCAFKKIRDFKLGDYIPKSEGTCPSCGGSFIIEEIYPEVKTKKGSKLPF